MSNESATTTTDNWVGFSAVTVLGYTLVLIGIHMFIPHPSASQKVITLSYVSLTLLAIAQGCIVGTYFVPHINGMCICNILWWVAATCYICSIYCIKLVYIERVQILNQHPMLKSKSVDQWIKYLIYSLIATLLTSLGLLFALSDGKCHDDLTRFGCIPVITSGNIYVAIVMLGVDAGLFAGFCYKWWKLINVFKLSKDNAILIDMVQSFSIQFIVTLIAMLSCMLDGVINLYSQDYSIKIIFCVDCAVIASCNFAMIKESQAFMWKYLCWPCKIPRFLLRGTSTDKLKAGGPEIKRKREATPPTKPNQVPRANKIESEINIDGLPMSPHSSRDTTDKQSMGNDDDNVTVTTPMNASNDGNNHIAVTPEPPKIDYDGQSNTLHVNYNDRVKLDINQLSEVP